MDDDENEDEDDDDVDDPLPGDLLVKSEPSPQLLNSGIQFLTLSRLCYFFQKKIFTFFSSLTKTTFKKTVGKLRFF